MPPCSLTKVPKSRKISDSSCIPVSISRISASRSVISDSWYASSCGDNCLSDSLNWTFLHQDPENDRRTVEELAFVIEQSGKSIVLLI